MENNITAQLHVTADDSNIHVTCDGDAGDIALMALAAIHTVAKDIYDNAPDKLQAEKLIHDMQKALAPTSTIWCFDEDSPGAEVDSGREGGNSLCQDPD